MATTDRRSVARSAARPSSGRVLVLVVLTWGVAIGFALTVAADTRIGPVVFTLTKTHGVHLGDLYAMLACAGVALLVTVWIIVDHTGRKRRWARAQLRAAREQQAVQQEAEAYDGYEDEYQYDDEAYGEYYEEPDVDLEETVLIERDTGDYTGRHRPLN